MAVTKELWHSRISISLFFFFYGLNYSSWASRIPDVQQQLHLTDAQLGAVLLGMPIGSFLTLPLSGILVSKIGSRNVMMFCTLLYCVMLTGIGFAQNVVQLTIFLFLFGCCGNMTNISINTQALALEALYQKRIVSSFHGMWSVAGLLGASLGTYLMGKAFPVHWHFLVVAATSLCVFIAASFYLIHDHPGDKKRDKLLNMPRHIFISLGAIAFCSMMCSGAMFDWNGVYFKKVIAAPKPLIGAGYTAFMLSMAATRFIGDWLTHHLGFKKIIAWCGIFTAMGLFILIAFPFVAAAIAGSLLVGIGVSAVVPLVFSYAGKTTTGSPGAAIAAVSTLGFVGLLIGPPMIGFVAGLTSLKISFAVLGCIGLLITFITAAFKE